MGIWYVVGKKELCLDLLRLRCVENTQLVMPSRYLDMSFELQKEVMRVYEPRETEEVQDWAPCSC